MDQVLVDVFEQARKVVADADRKIAEEEERRRESEREQLLQQLGARMEDSFDFTSKEKLELQPRLDVQNGVGVVEFVVRSQRAIFLLIPGEADSWTLQVAEDGHEPLALSQFQGGTQFHGGTKTEQASRRLAAARIVTAIGNWVQNAKGSHVASNAKASPRRHDRDEPKPELTYGTMGKFLGY
jgi:hypothetical protein